MSTVERNLSSQSVLDSLLHEVAVLDQQGTIIAVNQAWKVFCPGEDGAPNAHGVGSNYLEVCDRVQGPGSADAVHAAVGIRAILAGEQARYQRVYPCETPTANLWFSLTVTPLQEGGQRCAVLVHEDVTARQVALEKLGQARDQAQSANAEKSTFVSSLSHELRTPLNAIIGFAQLLETEQSTSGLDQEAVCEIQRAGRLMTNLLNDVLDLSQVEAGQLPLKLETVALVPLLRRCESLMRPAAAARGLQVSLHLDESDNALAARADEQRLLQVLLNLWSNAIKYNHADGKIDVFVEPAWPAQWRLSVRDTGYGIPHGLRDQVFMPFKRLRQAGGSVEGAGLGLAICKGFVEAMAGTLDFVSRPGEGSTFSVTVPMASSAVMLESAGSEQRSVAPGIVPVAQRTILYLEDNPANLKFVQRALEVRANLNFVGLDDPEQFLTTLERVRPDLVLMDISLPGCSGYDMLALMREQSVFQRVPVLALSANAMTQDVERGLDAGFDRYLTKPINLGELLSVVEEALV